MQTFPTPTPIAVTIEANFAEVQIVASDRSNTRGRQSARPTRTIARTWRSPRPPASNCSATNCG